MKTSQSRFAMRQRAEEALASLLCEVSTIQLKNISRPSPDRSGTRFTAHVDVFGHSFELACELTASSPPANLRKALERLRHSARQFSATAAPMLIAPYLPPEAQAICKECCVGFLDFEGNARIAVGEVFIGKRAFTRRSFEQTSVAKAEVLGAPVMPLALGILTELPRSAADSRDLRQSGSAAALA